MKCSVISDQIDDNPERAFPVIRDAGYDYVELHNIGRKTIEELDDSEVSRVKNLLAQYGLKVSNLASTVFFVCPLYGSDHVTGFNESFHVIEGDRQAHLRHLKRACEIASQLGSPLIRLFPFRFPDNRKPPFGDTEDMNTILGAMKEASDIASGYDVTLAVENCPYSHLPKGEMTLELIRRLDRDNVRLLYDPANSYRAVKENVPDRYQSWDLEREIEELAPYIAHVHIKNYHYDPSVQPKPFVHVSSGKGDIQYETLLPKLDSAGYRGVISLEPEVSPSETMESMHWMKEQFG